MPEAPAKCFYCWVKLTRGRQCRGLYGMERRELTRDHVVPKSSPHFRLLTERQHQINVVLCCRRCNQIKGCRSPLEWLVSLQDERAKSRLAALLVDLGFTAGVVTAARHGHVPPERLVSVNG